MQIDENYRYKFLSLRDEIHLCQRIISILIHPQLTNCNSFLSFLSNLFHVQVIGLLSSGETGMEREETGNGERSKCRKYTAKGICYPLMCHAIGESCKSCFSSCIYAVIHHISSATSDYNQFCMPSAMSKKKKHLKFCCGK